MHHAIAAVDALHVVALVIRELWIEPDLGGKGVAWRVGLLAPEATFDQLPAPLTVVIV